MKILINDSRNNVDRMRKIFSDKSYEKNNLIFVHSYEEFKTFIENQLEKGQCDLDLIITNNVAIGNNPYKASSVLMLKNSLDSSYSHSNFRINSIPVILYSSSDDTIQLQSLGFNAIVKSNGQFQDKYLIEVVERHIRKWREHLIDDLERLGLNYKSAKYFKNEIEARLYNQRFGHNYERTFHTNTTILSKEFIAKPQFLKYDWLRKNQSQLGSTLDAFRKMYKYHIAYDRKNYNERTIIHRFLLSNRSIMERDVFANYLYETPLIEQQGKEAQICDFILRPGLPGFQDTTFLEIKKENVQLFVDKNRKRPRISSELNKHLYQISDYQDYSQTKENADVLQKKLGYTTSNYSYQLIAGRLEEKEEIEDVFNHRLQKHYAGIEVLTYEDYENLYQRYIDKFSRLSINY